MVTTILLWLAATTPAEASGEIQLRAASPVVLLVDGKPAKRTSVFRMRASGLEPGVHQVQIKTPFGRVLHEEEIEVPDDTLVDAEWIRRELTIEMVPLEGIDLDEPLEAVADADPVLSTPVVLGGPEPAAAEPANPDADTGPRLSTPVVLGGADPSVPTVAAPGSGPNELQTVKVPDPETHELATVKVPEPEITDPELAAAHAAEVANAPTPTEPTSAEPTNTPNEVPSADPAMAATDAPEATPAATAPVTEEVAEEVAVASPPAASPEPLVPIVPPSALTPKAPDAAAEAPNAEVQPVAYTEPEAVDAAEATTGTATPTGDDRQIRVALEEGSQLEVVYGDKTLRLEVREGRLHLDDGEGLELGLD